MGSATDRLEYAWKIKQYISQNIQFADSKANSIISISTLSIALLVFLPQKLSNLEAIIVSLSSLILLISIILALLTFLPRTYPRPDEGIIFWENILNNSDKQKYQQEYQKAFENSQELDQVLSQIYSLAQIARHKYKYVAIAIKWQIIGLVIFWFVVLSVRVF